jgi:hypothetical protein
VKDIAQSKDSRNYFVFECVDPHNPSTVVIGTWPENHRGTKGPAVEGWRIDLGQLKFVALQEPVTCFASSYAGPDDGSDLADLAKSRAAKKHTVK